VELLEKVKRGIREEKNPKKWKEMGRRVSTEKISFVIGKKGEKFYKTALGEGGEGAAKKIYHRSGMASHPAVEKKKEEDFHDKDLAQGSKKGGIERRGEREHSKNSIV